MSKFDALWQYQEAELKLDSLELKLKNTAARKKLAKLHSFLSEQQAQIAGLSKQLEDRQTAIEKLSAKVDDMQRRYDLEAGEYAIMEKDEECTAAEMTESRRAIEKLVREIENTARELFDTLAWIEKATAEYKETYQKAGKAKKEYDAVRAECDAERTAALPEINSFTAEIERCKKSVEPMLLKKYTSVKSHHAVPMAKVENNQCGGCNMSLPTSVVKRVAAGVDVVECENCGRILYA